MVLLVMGVVLIEGGGKMVATGGGSRTGVIAATEGLLVFWRQAVARCPGSQQKKQRSSWMQCCRSCGVSLAIHLEKERDEFGVRLGNRLRVR